MDTTRDSKNPLPTATHRLSVPISQKDNLNRPLFELTPTFLSPSLTIEQEQALGHVFHVAGLADMITPEACETKRRSRNLATMIFENRLPMHPFSSESLAKFASYVDAFPKVGFIWQKTLETEAAFIIPNPPLFEIDTEEFLQSFRTLFRNFDKLSCSGPLTLGLFLLFFHRVMLSPQNIGTNWAWVVAGTIGRTIPLNSWRW